MFSSKSNSKIIFQGRKAHFIMYKKQKLSHPTNRAYKNLRWIQLGISGYFFFNPFPLKLYFFFGMSGVLMPRLIFYRITRWGYLGVSLSIWLTSLRTTEGLTVNAFIDSLRTPTSNQVSREILVQSQILDFYNLASSVWLFPIPG